MAIARLARQAKRSYGFCAKLTAVVILGLCFIVVWSVFASPSTSVTIRRESFDNIGEPVTGNTKASHPGAQNDNRKKIDEGKLSRDTKDKVKSDPDGRDTKKVNGSDSKSPSNHNHASDKKHGAAKEKNEKHKENKPVVTRKENQGSEESDDEDAEKGNEEEEQEVIDGQEAELKDDEAETEGDLGESDQEPEERIEPKDKGKKVKRKGPLFDPNAHYSWKLCRARSKYNYIPCIDIEAGVVRQQGYRHRERSCPRAPPMCLVPLPPSGYRPPVHWPESNSKILYKNVAHPKLAAFIKKHDWLVEAGEFLTFPQNHSELNGGVIHYLESIEEMVPDIEWGKNIHVILEIGCTYASLGAFLLEKDVITLSLGLKNDLVDLAQVALERGFPTVVSPFGSRRLPFPSGVFDAIHCGGCSRSWHSNDGKLLLEMNRILRPGGYFILSSKHDSIEEEEAMSSLTASICWNILAHKTDEVSEVGVKIYQKPESNDIFGPRRRKKPPLCKENENPDAAWYVPMTTCLHTIPTSIEQRGAEWPEEWPKRLEAFPEWLSNDKEKLIADTNHWKAIVEKSYLNGIGIDWSNVRNVMDMKAIYGGFAAAVSQQEVWVMNVIPVHAPDTLPIIFERGLVGIYHDWCESFGTYPRSYDLLHADHLFSRLKNRCKEPVAIVVEMDRILRPGGWAIIREKLAIMNPLEEILKSLQWEIRMSYSHGDEGILCAQKTLWRP
ncbi:probable methyltransferase PMT28 isoform X1 [Benincasa hispida]|uniref:probable methyltransferase PMT28 isoform X1 n=1 Tax=Benincasa hispida TaxID=102211 RepID=UPI0018FFD373|nr:probable methyltransferase PMT28 isoform X1 [Benincasa hispida]